MDSLSKDLFAMTGPRPTPPSRVPVEEIDEATVRFAGDAGDGIQLAGSQLAAASAALGNAVGSLPELPAEIRAPAGTLAGVSSFQVHFSRHAEPTPGDVVHTLVALNPAALRAHLKDLEPGGIVLADTDAFTPAELLKAGYESDPLADGSLSGYRVFSVPMATRNRAAVAKLNLLPREADRSKNFFALGLVFWLYERPLEPTLRWIKTRFAKNPAILEANSRALKAGHDYGERADALPVHYRVGKAALPPGRYRRLSGSEALALGLIAATKQAELPLVFAGYPLVPASALLHQFCDLQQPGVRAVQAEDEAGAMSLAVGAAFGGALGATATSGPGLGAKTEALALAVMAELPCVLFDVQRAGPSNGLPSKTEQGDLLAALFGRPGECPLPVLAPCTPADGFAIAHEAARLAVKYMTPVLVLTDATLTVGSEPWRVPDLDALPSMEVPRPTPQEAGAAFQPYRRDANLARPWAIPGTPGLEHRTGGLEKEDLSGNVSYDPLNHEWMVQTRAKKIANVAHDVPPLAIDGPAAGALLVVGWGSTFGAIRAAVRRCRAQGLDVAAAHLRHLNPLPTNIGAVLRSYRRVLVPELNSGQLLLLLRAAFLVDAIGLHKVQGRPFLVRELEQKIEALLT